MFWEWAKQVVAFVCRVAETLESFVDFAFARREVKPRCDDWTSSESALMFQEDYAIVLLRAQVAEEKLQVLLRLTVEMESDFGQKCMDFKEMIELIAVKGGFGLPESHIKMRWLFDGGKAGS